MISRLTRSSSACFSAWRASISPAASSSCAPRHAARSNKQRRRRAQRQRFGRLPNGSSTMDHGSKSVPAELTKRFVNEPSTIALVRTLDAENRAAICQIGGCGNSRLCAVIGMAGKDRRDPVELFGKHHPHQLVRPGEQPEGERQIGLAAKAPDRARPARRSTKARPRRPPSRRSPIFSARSAEVRFLPRSSSSDQRGALGAAAPAGGRPRRAVVRRRTGRGLRQFETPENSSPTAGPLLAKRSR